MKRALITGVTGQDGSYLAERLLARGYEGHGVIRRSSGFNTGRIDHLDRDPRESDARLFLYSAGRGPDGDIGMGPRDRFATRIGANLSLVPPARSVSSGVIIWH